MKLLILISMALTQVSLAADEANFEKHKTEILAHIEKKISNLNEAKSCVSSAAKPEDMKKCHEMMKADRMEMKEGMHNMRMQHMQDKMKRMEEKKQQLQQEGEKK